MGEIFSGGKCLLAKSFQEILVAGLKKKKIGMTKTLDEKYV